MNQKIRATHLPLDKKSPLLQKIIYVYKQHAP